MCLLTQLNLQAAHLWPLECPIMTFALRSIHPVSDFKLILIFPDLFGSCYGYHMLFTSSQIEWFFGASSLYFQVS